MDPALLRLLPRPLDRELGNVYPHCFSSMCRREHHLLARSAADVEDLARQLARLGQPHLGEPFLDRSAGPLGHSGGKERHSVEAWAHTGEVERAGDGMRGLAVQIAARVCAAAAPGQVIATSTVKDVVAGSGIGFDDVGVHKLKGVPETRPLHAVRQ